MYPTTFKRACRRLPVLFTALSLLAWPAHASRSIAMDVAVTITPPACTPALSNDGIAYYGLRASNTLLPGRITPLPPQTLTLTIQCDAAALVALRLTDNRSASVVPGIVAAGIGEATLDDQVNFGLGLAAGTRIGGYAITFEPASYIGDQSAVQLMASSDGVTWRAHASGLGSKRELLSWGPPGARAIASYQAIAGNLTVRPFIDRPQALRLASEIELNGSTTLELHYL